MHYHMYNENTIIVVNKWDIVWCGVVSSKHNVNTLAVSGYSEVVDKAAISHTPVVVVEPVEGVRQEAAVQGVGQERLSLPHSLWVHYVYSYSRTST